MRSPEAIAREEKLATEFNNKVAHSIKVSRTRYAILTVIMFAIAGGIALTGQWMIVFCLVCVGLICVLQCLDAQVQLREVRRWSNKLLYPRVSILNRPEPGSATQSPTPTP